VRDPSIRRSVALFRAFLREQTDPEHCYRLLARDAAQQLARYDGPLPGRLVVDVGGGGGHFTEEFRRRGAQAYLFEPDTGELTARGHPPAGAVLADGYLLPLADGVADIAFSSNVLEHVADPYTFLSELVRVTRPGGLIYVSYTNWLSPWGGHEWAPWHYLGAERARARDRRRQAHARREPLPPPHRPRPAPRPRPRGRDRGLGALPLLAVPRRGGHPRAGAAGGRDVEPPPDP
jgi:SAM-dependent methyltransferase